MEDRFIPLNALLALCSATATSWPRPLFDAGYRIEALELPLQPPVGRKVVADVLYWRPAQSRALTAESKSGVNIDDDQAAAYQALDAADVVRAASVTVSTPVRPQLQTIYACLRGNEDRILLGLSKAGISVPVLSVGEVDVVGRGAPFEDDDLRPLSYRPLPVEGPPPALLTIDEKSPPEEFDRVVAPAIVACLALDRPDATIEYLAEESIPFFASYGRPHRNAVRAKVLDAARQAADAAPESLEFQPETNQRTARLRFLRSPEGADPRGRTQAYQAIRGRLEGVRRSERQHGDDQAVFTIFDDSDAELERELNEGAAEDDQTIDGEEA